MLNEFLNLRKQLIERDFAKMNNMQRKAVLTTQGPLLVLAGAGSGKTTVLVNRIANLIKYGRAYTSDEVQGNVTDTDLQLLKACMEDSIHLPFELASLVSVDAPRPWEILAITFTNKAANELKSRIIAMLGDTTENIGDIWACTFHSACTRILRRHGNLLGFSSHFTIYDTDDSKRTMKECQRQLDIDDKLLSHKAILSEIGRAKDSLTSPEEYAKSVGNDVRMRRIADAYECYQQLLKKSDAMDFDDIIVNTVRLFEEYPIVLDYYQDKFKYIMIDEYQDTNFAQYRLTSMLASKHKNICVVGDDDQSIYRFRGATIENILNFESQYSNAVTIRLEQNYRSTQCILDAANAVISNNLQRKGKELWTANGTGDLITVYTADDDLDEGRYIADKIMAAKAAGGSFSDNAVLYRMNAQSNSVETALVRSGIPYKIIGGHRFYERKEIRDAIAYLTVINNPSDSVRLLRIINEPKRGIGDATINVALQIAADLEISLYDVISNADHHPSLSRSASKLKTFTNMIDRFVKSAENTPPHDILKTVLEDTGYSKSLEADKDTYMDRMANLSELFANMLRYTCDNENATLGGFLEEVALMSDIDSYNADSENVILMTVHSAKGLEFSNVFLAGLEEGVFPGIKAMYNQAELEEERRLAYVAITRAKRQLYITNTRRRMLFGSTTFNPPSRFIGEIPTELLDVSASAFARSHDNSENETQSFRSRPKEDAKERIVSRGFSGAESKASQQPAAIAKFKVGDTVLHKGFGKGVVISTKPMANDCLLEIQFEKIGTKKIMAKFAKIEKSND